MTSFETGLGKLEIKQLILSGIEELCNRALQYDEASRMAFEALSGVIISVESKLPVIQADFDFYIMFCENGIILSAQNENAADAIIKTDSFQTVARFFSGKSEIGVQREGKLVIQGNLDLVDEVQNILTRLEIDWEEPLSHYTGDIVAHEVHRMVNDAGELVKKVSDFIENDLEDSFNQITAMFFKNRKPPSSRSPYRSSSETTRTNRAAQDEDSFDKEITGIEAMQDEAENIMATLKQKQTGQSGRAGNE